MHKYILTRGISRYVDAWKLDMEAVFLGKTMKDSLGNVVPYQAQLVLRPVQLWEMVYPEEHDAKVTNMIGDTGYQHHSWLLKIKDYAMRIFGLEFKKVERTLTEKAIPRPFVGVTILGNKPDRRDGNGNELL